VFSYDDFAKLNETIPTDAKLTGYTTDHHKLGRGDDAVKLRVQYVIGDYFTVLGVQPARGRAFQGDELRIERPTPTLIISDALWRGRFAAQSDIIGKEVEFNFRRYTIVGVAPPAFRGPDNDAADLWAPMNMKELPSGDGRWYTGRGTAWIRLLTFANGPSTSAAVEQAASLAFRQSTFWPDSLATARVGSLIEASLRGRGDKNVAIATRLAGVAAIILLIACANVANLFLARGMRRRREIAMRLALGVTRRRLIALLLMESVIVSLIGAAVALVVAVWGATVLREQLLPDVQWVGAAVNIRVLGFTVMLALVTGVLAGLVPALRSSRPDLADTLKGSARDGVFQRSRVRSVLLVAQSALSIVLLAGAGLFVRSLHSVETEDIGYDSERVVFAEVVVDPDRADRAPEVSERFAQLADDIRRLPNVETTGLAWLTPMRGISWAPAFLASGDSLPRVAGQSPFAAWVSPDFFAAVGIRLVAGRGFTAQDKRDGGSAMIISDRMARSYWPSGSAIGQCLSLGAPSNPCVPIVGIVTDAHFDGIIEKPSTQFYLPLADTGQRHRAHVITIRTASGHAPQVAASVRKMFRAEFAGWAATDVHLMSDDLLPELRPWRTGAALFSAAGILALLVAIVGIYSTISYTFAQRTHEIGVRVALGASAANVIRLVVGEGIRVVCVGVFIGIALALAAAKLVESMLYHTSARDPSVLIAVSIALLLVAVGACLVPAWRALRVDPATALRAD
jgi:predicted permease